MAALSKRAIEALGGVTAEQMERQIETVIERQENFWTSRLAEAQKAHEAELSRAYEAGFYDGNDDPAQGDIKRGRQGYKRIADTFVREGKIDYDKALETAWTLWQKSPLAKRVLSIKRDHIIGHNAAPTVDDPLKDVVNEFWKGNKLGKRASEFTIQLFGFGEQCYPVAVRESDGRVRIGYIDPARIHEIIKHPDNAMEDWAVVIGKSYAERRVYRIIREDEDGLVSEDEVLPAKHPGKLVTWQQAAVEPWEAEMLKEHGRAGYYGSCFYTKVNAVSNQSRGMSDLLQVADWIDVGDEVLFSLGEREQYAGWFAFDVTLMGADRAKVMERTKEIAGSPPKKGSANVHNDSEVWQQWAPDLNQPGSIETFRAVLGLVLGGMGFPVHWYGFGDDANRATAVAQGDPTEKSLEHDQGVVKDMFETMCRFAVDQAVIAGALAEQAEEYEIALNLPEVTTKDLGRVTASLSALAVALIAARDSGLNSHETAVKAWVKVLSELDIEVDATTELEAVAEEERKRLIDRTQQQNNALQQMLGQQPVDDQQPVSNGQALTVPENLSTTQGLNGAQIRAVLDVIENVRTGAIPRIAALELVIAVGVHHERAQRIINSIEEGSTEPVVQQGQQQPARNGQPGDNGNT